MNECICMISHEIRGLPNITTRQFNSWLSSVSLPRLSVLLDLLLRSLPRRLFARDALAEGVDVQPPAVGLLVEPVPVHVEEVEDDAVGPAEPDLDLVLAAAADLGDGGGVVLEERKNEFKGS